MSPLYGPRRARAVDYLGPDPDQAALIAVDSICAELERGRFEGAATLLETQRSELGGNHLALDRVLRACSARAAAERIERALGKSRQPTPVDQGEANALARLWAPMLAERLRSDPRPIGPRRLRELARSLEFPAQMFEQARRSGVLAHAFAEDLAREVVVALEPGKDRDERRAGRDAWYRLALLPGSDGSRLGTQLRFAGVRKLALELLEPRWSCWNGQRPEDYAQELFDHLNLEMPPKRRVRAEIEAAVVERLNRMRAGARLHGSPSAMPGSLLFAARRRATARIDQFVLDQLARCSPYYLEALVHKLAGLDRPQYDSGWKPRLGDLRRCLIRYHEAYEQGGHEAAQAALRSAALRMAERRVSRPDPSLS